MTIMDDEMLDKIYAHNCVGSLAVLNNDGDIYENHLPITEELMAKMVIATVRIKLQLDTVGRETKGFLLKSEHIAFLILFFPDFIVISEVVEGGSANKVEKIIRETLEGVTLGDEDAE